MPDRARLEKILLGYFGEAAQLTNSVADLHACFWEFLLPRSSSQEADWFDDQPRVIDPDMQVSERWIQVQFLDHRRLEQEHPIGWVHVITRSQDPFTMAVADGLVRVIVRLAKGRTLNPND